VLTSSPLHPITTHSNKQNITKNTKKACNFKIILTRIEPGTFKPQHIGPPKEEHRLKLFDNRALREISGLNRDEIRGSWRKLHNEELHKLYSSKSTIRMNKSRRMTWAKYNQE
jgi:hypothetical protein